MARTFSRVIYRVQTAMSWRRGSLYPRRDDLPFAEALDHTTDYAEFKRHEQKMMNEHLKKLPRKRKLSAGDSADNNPAEADKTSTKKRKQAAAETSLKLPEKVASRDVHMLCSQCDMRERTLVLIQRHLHALNREMWWNASCP